MIAVQDFVSSTKDPSRPPYISLLLFPNDRCNSQLRSAAFHLMRTGVPGFKIDNMLGGPREGEFNDSFFIADGVHPFGESGHRRVLAYLFLHPPSEKAATGECWPICFSIHLCYLITFHYAKLILAERPSEPYLFALLSGCIC